MTEKKNKRLESERTTRLAYEELEDDELEVVVEVEVELVELLMKKSPQ